MRRGKRLALACAVGVVLVGGFTASTSTDAVGAVAHWVQSPWQHRNVPPPGLGKQG